MFLARFGWEIRGRFSKVAGKGGKVSEWYHNLLQLRCTFQANYDLCRYDVDAAISDGCKDV